MTGAHKRGALAVAAGIAALVLLGTPAQAYYHYIHFLSGAPFTPAYEKFDFASLLDKTVSVYVSDTGPRTSGSDSFASVLSQVKQAAAVWNSVNSSDLRVVFSGVRAQGQSDSTPGIEVVFSSDLAPGVLGEAAPIVANAPVNGPDGAFFPIVGSVVLMNSDTSAAPGPSYAETYFTTAVHELGHALGLQHTFTASAMSQGVIRDTTRTTPIGPDDMAAISVLYGKAGWKGSYGSVSGRVTSNGQGVSLASVVALPVVGSPVSTLTNPDGTYRLDGLPPGQYLLYVHPLPPDADVTAPKDTAGNSLPASPPFETVFFPASGQPGAGTRDLTQAVPVSAKAGETETGVDVEVVARAAVRIYDVVTFSYFDSGVQTYTNTGNPVTPAFVNSAQSATKGVATIVFQSISGKTPVPQSVAILGGLGAAQARLCCSEQAVAVDFYFPFFTLTGPRHLVLNFGDDMYVLPNAVNLVTKNPPAISAVTPNGDGTVSIAGSGLDSESRVFFDGLEAAIQQPFSGTEQDGAITVVPPPGASGQVANVIVYNSDGQNSMTLDSVPLAYGLPMQFPPPTYAYPSAGQPQINITPQTLPAGAFAKVDITAANMTFAGPGMTVGFGTDDVKVRNIWVLSPTHLIANVVVAPKASLRASEVSVISGFQMATAPNGFQTAPANPAKPAITAFGNGIAAQGTLYTGGYVTLYGSNLTGSGGAAQVSIDGAQVPITFTSASQVNFQIPADFPTGPATLILSNGVDTTLPLVVPINMPPPVIAGIGFLNGPINSDNPALVGGVVTISVTGLDPTVATSPERVRVTAGGIDMKVVQITAQPDGRYSIDVLLAQAPTGAAIPIAVWVDGSSSNSFEIPVKLPPPPTPGYYYATF